ncbi:MULTISPECIES: hypothetical protein [unclassified Pseudoalteromonas]|uniref:hypothetical protein n=1 Tax=unclassified Pseudoalteromonas TaxID=194690 RepID=UPI0005A73A28|nr:MULTISPECIES: hypothetical protein [unclassified Pseudoalteromonas]
MNIKTLVHTLHSALLPENFKAKKSHLYEFVSAYYGYGSYAAFQACNDPIKKITTREKEHSQKQSFERALNLNYEAATALKIAKSISDLNYSFEKSTLENIAHYLISLDEAIYLDELDKLDDVKEVTRLHSDFITQLRVLIKQGSTDALLCGLVLCTSELDYYESDSDNIAGDYWYEKRLAGEELSPLRNSVADNFMAIQPFQELLSELTNEREHLEFSNLNKPQSTKSFSDIFYSEHESKWTSLFQEAPHLVVKSLDYLFEKELVKHSPKFHELYTSWNILTLLNYPSKEAIAFYINSSDSYFGEDESSLKTSMSNNEKWFWYYYGLQNGFDITQDKHIAINRYTGEEWDGYGPLEVGGYDGLNLPEIPYEAKLSMQKLADTIF